MNAREYLNKYHPTAIRSMDEISKLVPGIDDFAEELIKMMEEYAKLTRTTVSEEEITEVLYDNSAGEWENMGYTMLDELRVEPTVEAIKQLLNR